MRRLVLRLTIAAMVTVMMLAGSAAPAAAWGFRDCDRDDPCRGGFVARDFDRDDFLTFNRFDRDDCEWFWRWDLRRWVLVCDF
jgi:hypothetical protein